MRIVLAGGYDTKNLGDHGMLTVLARELRARFGAVEITLLSRRPDAAFDARFGVRSIESLDHPRASLGHGRFLRGFNRGDDDAHLRAIARAIAAADALAVGGGRVLVDHSLGVRRGPLAYFAELVSLARFLGTPVVLLGHSIVPPSSEAGCEHMRFLFANAAAAAVREQASLDCLSAAGVDASAVRVLPDPAFGLERVAPASDARLAELGLDPARPLVALCVRSYAWRDGRAGARRTEASLAQILDLVLERMPELQLVFVPQMTYRVDTPETDDREVAAHVAGAMRHGERCALVREELDVGGALALYCRAASVLSMRRLGLVFAATQGTPGIALSGETSTDSALVQLGRASERLALEALRDPGAPECLERMLRTTLAHPPDVLARVQPLAARAREYAELFAGLAGRR